ncbi:hypothetical protein EBQ34_01195 [Vandammella animalimorsus]|uniref:Uncharacterized protein n=1 Tax=Vandammella animalimorsus TaxID=2029117 RepID=A0A3M6RUF0_9BURK|nr:hypothetical protein [Vandammella animalimorsus]RMX19000.1 hypothetical protein EBQ34_01195 [Vandammella animalimorsus]
MPLEKEELLLLGKMDGKLDSITSHLNRQDKRLAELDQKVDVGLHRLDDKIESNHVATRAQIAELDKRLRDVEKKSAVVGAVGGSAAGVGVALIVEAAKNWLRGGL